MDIWDEIKKLTGYQSGNGGVDSYGVDHSGFSTRDELEYQSARLARENQLAEGFAKQGIAEENYPQFGTNFWGGTPENNYGFGTSNIKQNIENVTNRLNNNTNNGQVFANSDYTVNTESLIGKPSSYFQNNNTSGWNNTGGFGSEVSNSGFSTNTNMGATTNFGANQSFATTPNSIATSTAQNQTPTPWSYDEPSTTPTPWSTTTATPTPWNNGATYPQQMITQTPWSNPAEQISPVPWQNNQTVTPWAGGYDLSAPTQSNSNYISDEDLYARMWENIKEQEGVKPHPYLDTKGLITIGGGANVNDWNVFKNLNVTVNGIPATETQKWEAYNRMRQLSEEKDANGNYVNRNLKAKAFENKTNIRISDAEARGLAQNHMNNDLAHLRGEFSDFDNFPLPLKEVLLDIQYNTGNLNQQNWPNLYRAIRNHDVNGIVSNVHRRDVAQRRNNWTRDTARSIRF